MAKAASNASSEIGVAVLSKAMDTFRENGAAMTKMLEQSVTPHIGSNFDMSV